jgi:DNA-binding MarR family transcriptional regulator
MTTRTGVLQRADAESAARLRLVITRLTRVVRRHANSGLTPSQLSALATVEELGSTRLSDLAAHEGVSAPMTTRVVTSLEELGYVQRVSHATDRRSWLIELTDEGRSTLDELWNERAAVLAARIAGLTPEQAAVLDAALPVLETLVREP